MTKAGSQVVNHVIKIVSIEKVVKTKAGSQVLSHVIEIVSIEKVVSTKLIVKYSIKSVK